MGKLSTYLSRLLLGALGASIGVSAVTIAEINGKQYLSPYSGQQVSNVTGIVTAKSSSGLFLRGIDRVCDKRVSNSLYVYGSALGKNTSIAVGDTLTLSGRVTEYRSSVDYLYATELESPRVDALVKATGSSAPTALVIGVDTPPPPTEQYSSLDGGDIFSVPNNQSQISVANPILQPATYGLDFWESLSGELVLIRNPVAVSKPNSYGDTWVVGDWPTTGKNGRGGLTLTSKDANPEAIIVGSPLDGTKNKDTFRIGDTFEDITGIVHYQYGFYYVLPQTALQNISSASPALPPPTTLTSNGSCSGLTVGDYNIENFSPSSKTHVQEISAHIATYMKSPDILFVQEVQDNSGPTDDGVVDANVTLTTLIAGIKTAGGASNYAFVEVIPENDTDGGQPGGNIRQAFLYRTDVVRLAGSGTQGGALDANKVLPGPALLYNPGRIEPTNAAFKDSRKPLVAQWETVQDGAVFFTVNVHWSSKGGSTSLQGDARPPVNSPIEARTQQANATASFIAEILAQDVAAAVIFAGDCNEFAVAPPMETFVSVSGLVDLDVAVGIDPVERYTYTYGANIEELDHIFVSPSIAQKSPSQEHLHVNTWVNYDDQVSDHDPTVAKINVCRSSEL